MWRATLGLLAFVASSAAIGQAAEPVRNLIVVSIDSLRADHLPAYGYPRETTPELDRRIVAGAAVVFARATAVTASCHPSHTSMLTGLFPQQVGVPGCGEDLLLEEAADDEPGDPDDPSTVPEHPPALARKKLSAVMNWLSIPEGQETLATFLQGRGFRTGGFVSIWTITRRFGYERGFDVFDDRLPEYYGPKGAGWIVRELLRANRRQVGAVTVDRALEFLDEVPRDRRFFVFIHLADTHVPYATRDVGPFEAGVDARRKVEAAWEARYADATLERAMSRMHRDGPDFLLDRYDRAIRYTDRELGRLFDWLERTEHGADTLVIVTSDHGDSMGQHFYLSERYRDRLFFEHSVNVWEETQHVPLVLFDPALSSAPRIERRNASHVDIVPTVLRRLGFDAGSFGAGGLPGRDLLEPGTEPRTVFFLTFGRGEPGLTRPLLPDFPKFIGFRRDDLKFFVDRERFRSSDRGSCFLYDLTADPDELRNLCDRPAGADVANSYRNLLVDWYGRSVGGRRSAESRPNTPAGGSRSEGSVKIPGSSPGSYSIPEWATPR